MRTRIMNGCFVTALIFGSAAAKADDGGLVQHVLQALDARFSTERVKIDTSVYNAARICKVYGTLARKGDNRPDRPHRRAKILEVPGCPNPYDLAGARFAPVPTDLLQALAAEVAPFGIHVTLVEPAGYATDWSGPSAKRAKEIPAYQGARDAIANVRQPGTNRGGVEHYFGSCATRAFAVAALGPSGASFKYVLNSLPASWSLPSLTSAMPS